MSARLVSSVLTSPHASYVKLAGVIDEESGLAQVDTGAASTVFVDCGDIERINSCGVRDWVNWCRALEANGKRAVLVDCAPPIVAQINLVSNFTGGGAVRSIQLPYYCSRCDEEKVYSVAVSELPQPATPPVCRCDSCQEPMDFDDMPASYFSFLGQPAKLDVDATRGEWLAAFLLQGPALRARGSGGRLPSAPANHAIGTPASLPSLSAAVHRSGKREDGHPVAAPAPGGHAPATEPRHDHAVVTESSATALAATHASALATAAAVAVSRTVTSSATRAARRDPSANLQDAAALMRASASLSQRADAALVQRISDGLATSADHASSQPASAPSSASAPRTWALWLAVGGLVALGVALLQALY